MGSKVIDSVNSLIKENQRISFVCIYGKKDFHYLQGMINTLPKNIELVLIEVRQIEGAETTINITEKDNAKQIGFINISPENFRFDTVRNLAKSLARYEWIFSIDADERLCIDQHNYLYELINTEFDSFTFKVFDVNNNSFGIVRRLFKKSYDWVGACHEQILSLNCRETKLLIRHEGYSSKETLLDKNKRNLDLMLQDKDNNLTDYYKDKIMNTLIKIKELEKWQEKHQ